MAENMWTLQPVGTHEGFVVQEFPDRTIGNNLAAIQHNYSRTDLNNHFEVVGRNDPRVFKGV